MSESGRTRSINSPTVAETLFLLRKIVSRAILAAAPTVMEGTQPPCERRAELLTWENSGVLIPDTETTVIESDSESNVTRHANAAGVRSAASRAIRL